MTLLDELKNYLDITWQDEATDNKLLGMISRGKRRLLDLSGNENLDFEKEDIQKDLLFNRIRYERSGALDEFESAFKKEIIYFQTREKVKRQHDTK